MTGDDGIPGCTPQPVEFAIRRHSVAAELCLAGELDIASCPRLLAEVDRLLREGCRLLTIDLNAVAFMDASAIGALVQVREQMVANSGALAVICDGGQPRRLLKVAGMEAAFHLRAGGALRPSVKAVRDP